MGPVRIRRRSDQVYITLSENLTVSQATLLYKKLSKGLAAKLPVLLNGERVRQVDTATLQVLIAFCNSVGEQNLTLRYQTAGDYLYSSLGLLGLSFVLEPKREVTA